MGLPFFYIPGYDGVQSQIALDEDTSKHIVQVLRMKEGEQLKLTDGKGNVLTCGITAVSKRHCEVDVLSAVMYPESAKKITIAISIIKNSSRFEWFLEKATEIGVTEIIPLICERTEKERFRHDRMKGICISAMLQSQQCWLPLLREPEQFKNLNKWKSATGANFIAYCIEGNKQALSHFQISTLSHSLICIGPEGDFTPAEIELALQHQFIPVSLGDTRLRTETAGVVAATLLRLV
ncbi:MAG: 16S rRNA (uracil(1498)-N(3))-methyltransferase [Chitinophagaceae bacterium]|nr:16S rRNA (uracil(1498)-N(3))-methyltransferase [Chitinophagaceae bacterium]